MKKFFTLISLAGLLLFPHLTKASDLLSTKEMAQVLEKAESYLGTPYRSGGLSKRGIDCSGLMVNSFKEVGFDLPRTSKEQHKVGKSVSKKNISRGDLIFFSKGLKINHVGLVTYADEEEVRFIHATTSRGVIVSSLSEKYWRKRYRSARRLWKETRRERKARIAAEEAQESLPTVIRVEKKVENISAENRNKKRERLVKQSSKKGSKEALKTEKDIIRYEEKKKALATVNYPGRFPEASQRLLSLEELRGMDQERLTLMKYEILARNGFEFTTPTLQRYFGMQGWYREMKKVKGKKVMKELTSVEKANIKRIRSIELEKDREPEGEFLIKENRLMKRN